MKSKRSSVSTQVSQESTHVSTEAQNAVDNLCGNSAACEGISPEETDSSLFFGAGRSLLDTISEALDAGGNLEESPEALNAQAVLASPAASGTDKAEAEKTIRTINILVHGVNTDAKWYDLVEAELSEINGGKSNKDVSIPFSWGDYETQKQGGNPLYAVDEVHQMFENGFFTKDRWYQGHAAVRLKEIIDQAKATGAQVNVIAHSNGTAVTSGALMLGAEIDNFIMMGSPLDSDNDRSNKEINTATKNVKDRTLNFWSEGDEWAWIKGGIGANGDNATWNKENPDVENVEFGPGKEIGGTTITEKEVDHSDYMLEEHMPILSHYISEFGQSAPGGVAYDEEMLNSLRTQADWTNQSYYKDKENVDAKSPEFRDYKKEIAKIKKGS